MTQYRNDDCACGCIATAACLPLLLFMPLVWLGPVLVGLRDAAAAEAFGFSIETESLAAVGLTGKAESISGKVIANLHSQGYAITAGNAPGQGLEVSLGRIARQSTPAGFSYSFGNSDPRAAEFQRAFVLPITCRWHAQGDSGTEMTQEVAVNAEALSEQAAVDNIGSVCMTLLTDRAVPLSEPASGSAWKPPIRVEVRDAETNELLSPAAKPGTAAAAAQAVSAPAAPKAATAPVGQAAAAQPAVKAAESATSSAAPATPAESGVRVSNGTPAQSGHKKLIIHNLGSPVELEFGYQRR